MKTVPISEARRDLFQIFDRVVRKEGEKVIISRRGHTQPAALVSAVYLERLESLARRRRPLPLGQARMRGTMTVVGDPDTVLSEIRARQNALAEAKWKRFDAETAAGAGSRR